MQRQIPYVDDAGKALTDYPRPSVAVDTAVLTIADDTLAVVLVKPTDGARRGWALPGTFLHQGERLADAVRRSLADKAGITGRAPQQLGVFDDPKRDDRGWVLSAAHLDVVTADESSSLIDASLAKIVPVDAVPRLRFDHNEIVRRAVAELREQYARTPDPWQLLADAFTIADLRAVHEAVAGHPLQKDTFRRSMIDQLAPIDAVADGRVGRPAQLFTHATPPRGHR